MTTPTDGMRSSRSERTWAGSDVFVVELRTSNVDLVSVTDSEERGNLGSFWPSISSDGRFVAFESSAPNLAGRSRARGVPPAILVSPGSAPMCSYGIESGRRQPAFRLATTGPSRL